MLKEIVRLLEDMLPFRNVCKSHAILYSCQLYTYILYFDNHFAYFMEFTYIVQLSIEVKDISAMRVFKSSPW